MRLEGLDLSDPLFEALRLHVLRLMVWPVAQSAAIALSEGEELILLLRREAQVHVLAQVLLLFSALRHLYRALLPFCIQKRFELVV